MAPLVVGHQVDVALATGTHVRGEAVAVREESLVMEVSGVSGGSEFQ